MALYDCPFFRFGDQLRLNWLCTKAAIRAKTTEWNFVFFQILSDIRLSGQDGTDVVASLLFHEAQKNYIRGLYPCSDVDAVLIAATFLQITHGDYDNKKDKHFLSRFGCPTALTLGLQAKFPWFSEKEMGKLIPPNKLRNGKNVNWTSRVLQEHKHLSKKKGEKISVRVTVGICWQCLSELISLISVSSVQFLVVLLESTRLRLCLFRRANICH